MIRFRVDENVNKDSIAGLSVWLVDIDCVTVQEVGLRQTPDPDILTWAAEQRRIVLTNDTRTMTRYA